MHWAMVYPRQPPRARLSSSLQTPEVCHLFSFPPRQHVPLCPLGFWMSGDRPLLPWSLERLISGTCWMSFLSGVMTPRFPQYTSSFYEQIQEPSYRWRHRQTSGKLSGPAIGIACGRLMPTTREFGAHETLHSGKEGTHAKGSRAWAQCRGWESGRDPSSPDWAPGSCWENPTLHITGNVSYVSGDFIHSIWHHLCISCSNQQVSRPSQFIWSRVIASRPQHQLIDLESGPCLCHIVSAWYSTWNILYLLNKCTCNSS